MAKKTKETKEVEVPSSIERKYSKDKSTCKVKFHLTADFAPTAQKIAVVGSFNNWDRESLLMKKNDAGDFELEVKVESGKRYEFRYLIDGFYWENDPNADDYQWSEFAESHNSVINT